MMVMEITKLRSAKPREQRAWELLRIEMFLKQCAAAVSVVSVGTFVAPVGGLAAVAAAALVIDASFSSSFLCTTTLSRFCFGCHWCWYSYRWGCPLCSAYPCARIDSGVVVVVVDAIVVAAAVFVDVAVVVVVVVASGGVDMIVEE